MTMSSESITEELNSYYVNVFIPNIVWSILCLVIGIGGNSCVLSVYIFKMKNYGEQRYFIPVLAVFDLCATIFTTIYVIQDYFHFIDFESEIWCKFTVFFTYTWTTISAHTLLVIAVQRYLKICTPFGPQMTLFWRRAAIIITIGYSVVFSLPLLYSSGIKEFEWTFNERNITVKTCALHAKSSKQFYEVYFMITIVAIVLNILAIIGVYIPIGHVIFKSFKFSQRQQTHKATISSDVTTETYVDSNTCNESKSKNCTGVSNEQGLGIHEESIQNENAKQKETEISELDLKTSAKEMKDNVAAKHNSNKSQKEKVKVNFNLMFLTVIVCYLLSYFPVIAIFMVRSDEVSYWLSLSDDQVRLQMCLVRFYVINNVVNPFIYGYFDFTFRHSVKSLFRCSQ